MDTQGYIYVDFWFLAGSYFPLDLYPDWLRQILEFLPFAYIQYYPVKILMGETHLLPKALIMISVWMIPLGFLVKVVWGRGLRRYSGGNVMMKHYLSVYKIF